MISQRKILRDFVARVVAEVRTVGRSGWKLDDTVLPVWQQGALSGRQRDDDRIVLPITRIVFVEESSANMANRRAHDRSVRGVSLAGAEEEFREKFRASPIKRAKYRGIIRNACVAIGNSNVKRDSPAHQRIEKLLARLSESNDAIISEHAKWAMGKIS